MSEGREGSKTGIEKREWTLGERGCGSERRKRERKKEGEREEHRGRH